MSEKILDKDLHLPSLSIQGFRGIKDLTIPKLGRVTLLAGKNGVGKTTVLDAVRLYADRGSYFTIMDILQDRDELTMSVDENGEDAAAPDFAGLFFDRRPFDACISIGPQSYGPQLSIKTGPGLQQREPVFLGQFTDVNELPLKIDFGGIEQAYNLPSLRRAYRLPRGRGRYTESENRSGIRCQSSGPNVPYNSDIGRFWDRVTLNNQDDRAMDALRLVYGDSVKRVTMVADNRGTKGRGDSRMAMVSVEGQGQMIPLRSLGDGAVRMYSIALALANSRGGFLVIDEAENGIHHTVQAAFWRMVLRASLDNNVQVIATTHSWDCVVGFSRAATEIEEVDGLLVRLEKDDHGIKAVHYSERNLAAAADYGIETR